MKSFDAIVIGAGPAGSSCAGALRVTPDVFQALDMAPEDYPCSLIRFDKIQFHYRGVRMPVSSTQYSIRRYEFDDFLVEYSGVKPIRHRVRNIVKSEDGSYEIDGEFRAPASVGAGGTRCPGFRAIFSESNPRPKVSQIVALEKEFRFDWNDPRCHLFFFDDGLTGYSWYVPKQGGYLNCGVGGMAHTIASSAKDIRAHWDTLLGRLEKIGVPSQELEKPSGYSYYLRNTVKFGQHQGAYLIGDSAGLATRDLGEGIGPGVHSANAAAKAILEQGDYKLEDVYAYSPIKSWLSNALDKRWKKAN